MSATVRQTFDDAENRWLVVESLTGTRAWCGSEQEAIEVATAIASDPDTRGLVYVLELKAVVS